MKQTEKALKFPFITTIWPCNDKADPVTTIRRIQEKIITYGICSDKEQAFLSKYTDFGKTDQKQTI